MLSIEGALSMLGAGVASLGGKIFVVGGHGANYEDRASCECYDPKTKVWTRIPDMIGIRGYNKAVAIEGALIVAELGLGGIERYSPPKKGLGDYRDKGLRG